MPDHTNENQALQTQGIVQNDPRGPDANIAVVVGAFLQDRRAALAGINKPSSLHSFRRLFALSMLRAGVNIFELKKLMGHKSLAVLLRYLALIDDDARAAHDKGSPVDTNFCL